MALSADFCMQRDGIHLDVSVQMSEQVVALYGGSSREQAAVFKCLEGISRPDRGRIVVNGTVWFDSILHRNLQRRRRNVRRLTQMDRFDGKHRAQEWFGPYQQKKEALAGALATQLQLPALLDRPYEQLMSLERFRLQIAHSLLGEPDLILLEETDFSQDEDIRLQQELLLMETLPLYEGTVLFSAMTRGAVYRLCQSMCVLQYGTLQQQYSVRELFERPQTVAAGRLAGYRNLTAIERLDDTHVFAPAWNTVLRLGYVPEDAFYLGIHPRSCRISAGPGENVLPCTVRRKLEQLDAVTVVAQPEGNARTQVVVEIPKQQWHGETSLFVQMPPGALLPLR